MTNNKMKMVKKKKINNTLLPLFHSISIKINVTDRTLEEVAKIMQSSQKLLLKTRSALPLPMNASPLIRNYTKKQQKASEDPKNYSSLMKMVSQEDQSSTKKMNRTISDPHDDQSSGNHTPVTRERSVSLDHKDKVFTRGQMYRNGPTRSPVYDRKLPAIPDENTGGGGKSPESEGDHRAFSRASRYQAEKKPEPSTLCPTQPSHVGAKSPGLFRRNERKKSGEGMFTAPSNDSLSSMSDDENAGDERLHVFPSDNPTPSDGLKSYTGKLAVSIYKMIGRLSGIEADCYCTIEVDGESKASTQHQKIKELVNFNESFEIELQKASVLSFFIFHKHGKKSHKLASQSHIYLESVLSQSETKKKLLLGTSSHVQMRIKLNFTAAESYTQRSHSLRQNGVFGFNLAKTLAKEENTIPVIVRKCVEEIEKRALEIVGIYRISGNARKKKHLRAQFEENSLAVDTSNEDEVDCHVLAGILKDYLRELPNPLISDNMYHNIYNKGCVKNKDQNNLLRELLKELPYTNRATLIYIMDHLKRVAAKSEVNKMTHQNLAVCFGPVMMSSPVATAAMLDFKKQIDALEFLLNIWPVSVELQNGI
uniref:Rho-GAP domain-containing protein n=1 Tax=Clytia hemisphaerica TaxID=252671 RepID=A0A7M5WIP2_9CNID